MKKFYLLLLIIPVIAIVWYLVSLASNVGPDAVSEYDFRYTISEDGTVKINSYSGENKVLELPTVLGGHTVSSLGNFAFYFNVPVREVTIPDSIVSLEANPFLRCKDLTKISVSASHPTLTVIDGALIDKTQNTLISYPRASAVVTIPEGITAIGDYAYGDCDSLTEIAVPSGVTSIGNGAFYFCTSLTAVTLPEGVTSIGDEAFMECTSLATVTIPDSITSIGNRAFYRCKSISEITIPDGITFIGPDAFLSCYGLTLSVGRDSYGEQYAKENDIPYTYTNAIG